MITLSALLMSFRSFRPRGLSPTRTLLRVRVHVAHAHHAVVDPLVALCVDVVVRAESPSLALQLLPAVHQRAPLPRQRVTTPCRTR